MSLDFQLKPSVMNNNYAELLFQNFGTECLNLDLYCDDDELNNTLSNLTDQQKAAITAVFTESAYISTKGLVALATACPNISSLRLANAHRTGNKAVRLLANMLPKLKELNLHFANDETKQLKKLKSMRRDVPRLKDLSHKDPSLVKWITNSSIKILLNNCTQLTNLDLSGINITTLTLKKIMQLPIQYLAVDPFYHISIPAVFIPDISAREKAEKVIAAIDGLQEARPDLTIIDGR